MSTVWLPRGWEAASAPVATLLDPLGSPWLWWLLGAALLAAATAVTGRRAATAVLLATLAAAALAVAGNGLVDDAYIQFRYAAHLAAGHGPVFNPGERVEGASGGLWIFILAGLSRLSGGDPGVVARLLGIVIAAATVPAAATAVRSLAGALAGARAAVLWAAYPTAALFGATGLETGAFALSLWLALAAAATGSPAAAVAGGALIATLRPEGLVLAVAALPLWRRLPPTGRTVVAATLVAGGIAAAARSLYFGLPVPNSALVKGVFAAAGPGEGLAYLGRAALELLPLLALALLAARRSPSGLPFALPAAVWAVLVVARGGDWMPGSRYLIPVAVVVVCLAALAELRRPAAATLAAVLWCAVLTAPMLESPRLGLGSLWRAMAEHRVQSRWWEALGAWLRTALPDGTTLATGPSGAVPYAARLPTFDLYGLCSPVLDPTAGDPGHRLWGIRPAVAAKIQVLYPGRPLPQHGDQLALMRAAQAGVGDHGGVFLEYRPLVVRHVPEYHRDILVDVLWLRRDLELTGSR